MDSMERQAIRAYVPRCVRRISPVHYRLAMAQDSEMKAYEVLLPIADMLPIPLVKPWKRDRNQASGFIPRVGDYDPDYPNDHRDTEQIGRIVGEFSRGAVKPKPRKRGRKRVVAPKSYIGRVMEDGTYEFGADNQPSSI